MAALMSTRDILDVLPHRYPFLLIDKVLELDLDEGRIVAQKNITFNEEFFQGHFPGAPIMPGVLILEALAQAGGVLLYKKGATDKTAVFLNVKEAKFRNPVKPGDILFLHVQGLHFSSKGGRVEAKAMVGDKLAVQAEIGFAFVDKSQI